MELSSYAWQRKRMNNINRNIAFFRIVQYGERTQYPNAPRTCIQFKLLIFTVLAFTSTRWCGSIRSSLPIFNPKWKKKKKRNTNSANTKRKSEKHGDGDCDLRWIMWSERRRCAPIYLFFVYFFLFQFYIQSASLSSFRWCTRNAASPSLAP